MTLTKKEYEDLLTELISLSLYELKKGVEAFKPKQTLKVPKSTGVAQ